MGPKPHRLGCDGVSRADSSCLVGDDVTRSSRSLGFPNLLDLLSGPSLSRVYSFWHSRGDEPSLNVFGYRDPEVDQALEAASAPVGQVASAVMLHSKLRSGLKLMELIPLTGSLGERGVLGHHALGDRQAARNGLVRHLPVQLESQDVLDHA